MLGSFFNQKQNYYPLPLPTHRRTAVEEPQT